MCISCSILTAKKKQMCIYGNILISKKTQNVYIWHHFDPKNLRIFSPAAGCVKIQCSLKNFPLATPPLPQNMYNWQKNHVFKSDNKMCTYGSISGKKIKNLKKKNNIKIMKSHESLRFKI